MASWVEVVNDEGGIVMKFKIVSGGQTGVDRAGLEAAIALGLPYGGWVPKGRLAEDGVVPLKYAGMQEHTSSNYAVRTKANVRDSDATLIIAPSLPLSGGTMLTLRTAERLHRPHHVACLGAAELPRSVDYHGGVGDVDLLVDYDRRLFFGRRLFEERVVV